MDTIAIGFAGYHIDFDLNHLECTWIPADERAADLLHDSTFPLIAVKHGRRYELNSDGTFNEIER